MKHQNPQNSFHPILRKHLNADALMSGFAMFSLKDPSLLAFDERRGIDENLRSIYLIENAPCDTQMRKILDEVNPESLSRAFKGPFRQLQRGKALEPRIGDVGKAPVKIGMR